MESPDLIAAVQAICPAATVRDKSDRSTVQLPADQLVSVARRLRDDPALQMNFLEAHTAVDWPAQGQLELLYVLTSLRLGHHLTLSVAVPREKPVVCSVSEIWPIAHWQEREAYDLFGVRYRNHSDLRRLFLDDGWPGHPLLKDYRDDFMLEPL